MVQNSGRSSSGRSRVVNSRAKDDVLERFFQWGETNFCSDPRAVLGDDQLAPEKEPDVLDYVFEHVESFTCAGGEQNEKMRASVASAGQLVGDHFSSLRRRTSGVVGVDDNSLVDGQHNHQLVVYDGNQKPKSGGDLLDYCFESVESFVCTEGNEEMLLGSVAPPNKYFDCANGVGCVGGGAATLSTPKNKEQLRRAKAAIEAQLNAMEFEEGAKAAAKNKKNKKKSSLQRRLFQPFSSSSKKKQQRSNSNGSSKKSKRSSSGSNDSPIPTNISITTPMMVDELPPPSQQQYTTPPAFTAQRPSVVSSSMGDVATFKESEMPPVPPVPVTPPPTTAGGESPFVNLYLNKDYVEDDAKYLDPGSYYSNDNGDFQTYSRPQIRPRP